MLGPRTVGLAAMALAAFLWSTNIFFGKVLLENVPPYTLSLLRQCVTTLICLPILAVVPTTRANVRGRVPLLVLIGLVGFAIPHTLVYLALEHTSAISLSIINTIVPALVVAIGLIAFGLRPNFLLVLGILVSMCGALLIILAGGGDLDGFGMGTGELIGVAAMVSAACYTALTGSLARNVSGVPVAALGGGAGALLLLPLAAWELSFDTVVKFDMLTLIGIAYVGIFPSAVAMTAWSIAIRRLGPESTSQGVHLIPLFTAILSISFLNEQLQSFQLVAAALAIGGVYITRLSFRST